MAVSSRRATFYTLLSEAMEDMQRYGYDSQARLDGWMKRLRSAAREALVPEATLQAVLGDALGRVFRRSVQPRTLLKRHPGLSEFTLRQIEPRLHAELSRRIAASADLIKLNRAAAIEKTLQRFAGWATAIPHGGGVTPERREETHRIRKGIAGLPFEERRVIIDQGHKLAAAIDDLVASDGGAIAGIWRHVREAGYNARPEHLARDGELFVVRGNWALERGLMKLAGHEYMDQIEAPAQLPYCRCKWGRWVYSVGELPREMLTAKGLEELQCARRTLRTLGQGRPRLAAV